MCKRSIFLLLLQGFWWNPFLYCDIFTPTLLQFLSPYNPQIRTTVRLTEIMSHSLFPEPGSVWAAALCSKQDLIFSCAILEIHSHKDESVFLWRCSHQTWALCLPELQLVPFISENVSEQSTFHWGPTRDVDDTFQQDNTNCVESVDFVCLFDLKLRLLN